MDMWALRFPNRRRDDFVFPACETVHIDPANRQLEDGLALCHICRGMSAVWKAATGDKILPERGV